MKLSVAFTALLAIGGAALLPRPVLAQATYQGGT